MEENTFTFDTEFEPAVQKKFLSLLIFDQQWAAINGLEVLKPEYFENRILSQICYWIKDYFKKYKKIPTKLVLTEKAKDWTNKRNFSTQDYYAYMEALDDIFTIKDSDDFEFFKEKLVYFVRQIAWKQALYNGGDALKIGNYEEAIKKFKDVLSLGMDNDLGLDLSTISTEDFLDLLSSDYDPDKMLKTGIDGLDKALGGGFVTKNLHIIGAPPGSGKSRSMSFFAKKAVEAGKKVVFITLELSEAETVANIYSSVTGITLHDMLNPICREEFKEKVADFKDRYGMNLVVKFFKPGSITADTIHNFIKKYQQIKLEETGHEWNPDAIFLDYMDKLLPISKIQGNSYQDMGNVATDCKNLGITFDCPIITGSQLGKFSWALSGNDVVSMSSVAESAAKIHLAHSFITFNENPGEKEKHLCRIYMAKSRSGTPGKIIWVEKNLGKCRMFEVEPWDPKEIQENVNFSIRTQAQS